MVKRLTVLLSLIAALAMATAASAQTPPAQTTIAGTAGPIVITALFHASTQIEFAGHVIQVDPSGGDLMKMKSADVVFVTDIHEDHFSAGRIERFRKPGAPVVVPAAVRELIDPKMAGPIEVLANGQQRTIAGLRVEAIAAYNIVNKMGDEPFHTKGRGNGYVITIGGKRLFFAGDTECVPEIKTLQSIDVAFLPMNLPFTMSPEDAAACAAAFKPKMVIPYHYMGGDPGAFETAMKATPAIEVRMLEWYPAIERPDVIAIARPGTMIDVGGRMLHLNCSGRGAPAVILDGGDSWFAIDWMLVQPELAKSHRVCSFDRLDRGWSGASNGRESNRAAAADVHAALTIAGERPPYVLVGAGAGTNFVRHFELVYPTEVVGAVLVDGVHEDGMMIPLDGKPAPVWSVAPDVLRAQLEQMRPPADRPAPPMPLPPPLEDAPFDRLPADVLKTRVTFERRMLRALIDSSFDDRLAGFMADREDLLTLHKASVAAQPQFGDRPLISLRAKEPDSPFTASRPKLATLSSKGVDRVITAPVPYLQLSQPAAVIAAIQEVLMKAATR